MGPAVLYTILLEQTLTLTPALTLALIATAMSVLSCIALYPYQADASNVDLVMGGDATSPVITGLDDQGEGAKHGSSNHQGEEATMSKKRKIVKVDNAFDAVGLVDPALGIVDLCSSSSSSSSSDDEQGVQDGKDGRDTRGSTASVRAINRATASAIYRARARARASNKGGGTLRTPRNTVVGDVGDGTPHAMSVTSSASSSGFLAPRERAQASAQAKGGGRDARDARGVEKMIDLTHSDMDSGGCDMGLDPELSDDKEDSGFIPFTRSFSPDSSLSRKGKAKRENKAKAKGRGSKMRKGEVGYNYKSIRGSNIAPIILQ